MKCPVIGITIDTTSDCNDVYESPVTYAQAVERAGGLPLLFPYKVDHSLIAQYVDLIDGMLFTGGNDMDPALYSNEAWHPKVAKMDPDRTRWEMALLQEIEKRRTPTLGVCFGCQLINVYRGGSLIQFLPDHERRDKLEHRRTGEIAQRHPVTLDVDSQLGRAIGKRDLSVNTYHKQGIKQIGKGLRVIATSPDGIVEAYEDPGFPLLTAVQWHPERLIDEPEHLAPFKLLVEKARR